MSDVINIGSEPFDDSADTAQEAFNKINGKFVQVDSEVEDKVDKVPGKGLSTDDFQAGGHYPNLRAGATTKDDVGLGNVENLTPEQVRQGVTKEHVGLGNVENLTTEQVRQGVTKQDVGLGNAENETPDQIRAPLTKQDVGLGNVENETPDQIREGITKQDVGLGNVENLSAEQIRQGVTKQMIGLDLVANYPIASQAEAETGSAENRYMTPLRVNNHFTKRMAYGTAEPDDNVGDDGDLYFEYQDL